ncbi:MAG: crossover junction endodeoxyribonuclease RuvC [Gammaproteobacteria bacterium]|nr:crossover junction endodeoxyribonuclease RuvC [Gammaproteobacteria bacterium]
MERVILGIDPGSINTGFGIISSKGNQINFIGCGTIRTGGGDFPTRLQTIFMQIQEVVHEYQPHEMAIENVFLSKNPDSALKLGQARGAAICAVMANHVSVAEYTANQVKQAIVGKGHATKEQVQHMVKFILKLDERPQADAADALAIAICHANTRSTLSMLSSNAESKYPKEILAAINGRRKKRFKL